MGRRSILVAGRENRVVHLPRATIRIPGVCVAQIDESIPHFRFVHHPQRRLAYRSLKVEQKQSGIQAEKKTASALRKFYGRRNALIGTQTRNRAIRLNRR